MYPFLVPLKMGKGYGMIDMIDKSSYAWDT
jgi:hypothetical protein